VRPRPPNVRGSARTHMHVRADALEMGLGGRGEERWEGEGEGVREWMEKKNTKNNVYFYLSYMYRTNYLLKDF
jgi:hypothetical protein